MSDGAVCFLIVAIVSIGFLIYGFTQVLGKQLPSENDTQVIQRQIRGFAFLMLAQIAMIVGSAICTGLTLNLREILKVRL
jgi:hypothetical protein